MEIYETTPFKEYRKEISVKCRRYKLHLLIGMTLMLIASILAPLMKQPLNYDVSLNIINLSHNAGYIFVLIIGIFTAALVNLPHEIKYQSYCSRNKASKIAANVTITAVIAFYAYLLMTFAPYFASATAIGVSMTNGAYYTALIAEPISLFFDILTMGLICWLSFSLVYKIMNAFSRGFLRSLIFIGELAAVAAVTIAVNEVMKKAMPDDFAYLDATIAAVSLSAACILIESIYLIDGVLFKRVGKKL